MPLTLTTEQDLTMEKFANEDCPKKQPPISGSLPLVAVVALKAGCGPKLSSLKLLQLEWPPVLQISQFSQKAKERRTGSPSPATLTPGPTLRTYPEPIYYLSVLLSLP